MEEMLEKMSLTTSSGKALLLRASFSSSWKKTCSRRWVTEPVGLSRGRAGAPTPDTSPGETSRVPGALGSLPTQLPEHFHLLNLPSSSKNPGKRDRDYSGQFTDGQTKGLGQRLAADECQEQAHRVSVKASDFARLKTPVQ